MALRDLDGSDFLRFAGEFIKKPTMTAALAPSSRHLGEVMTSVIPESGSPVIVELGPGTGSFTELIQDRLAGRGRHIAIELNENFCSDLRRRYPAVEVVHEAADQLPRVLEREGVRANIVVSGLPWAAFWRDGSLIQSIARSMSQDGAFTQFGYPLTRWAPAARKQFREFQSAFEEVQVSRTIWRNLPPGLVYFSRRPRSVGSA
ncbi:SAM-dependent methyltransferase [Pseudonocardiaceae bacterium YIM PH 21723]|nr:SAM-dependent methyltransferase [Pseudonocardiaceae bacterium YIM PH 21723]